MTCPINSSPPSATYKCQWIGSALVRIMACRLFGAKPLSNQCWVIVNWTLRNELQWNFNQDTKLFIHSTASENIVCEMAAILSRGKWGPCRRSSSRSNNAIACCEYPLWDCTETNAYTWSNLTTREEQKGVGKFWQLTRSLLQKLNKCNRQQFKEKNLWHYSFLFQRCSLTWKDKEDIQFIYSIHQLTGMHAIKWHRPGSTLAQIINVYYSPERH